MVGTFILCYAMNRLSRTLSESRVYVLKEHVSPALNLLSGGVGVGVVAFGLLSPQTMFLPASIKIMYFVTGQMIIMATTFSYATQTCRVLTAHDNCTLRPTVAIYVQQVLPNMTAVGFVFPVDMPPTHDFNAAHLKDAIKAEWDANKDTKLDALTLTVYASDEARGGVKVTMPSGDKRWYKKVPDPKAALRVNEGKDDPPYLFELPK
jgi:hypothetical protein